MKLVKCSEAGLKAPKIKANNNLFHDNPNLMRITVLAEVQKTAQNFRERARPRLSFRFVSSFLFTFRPLALKLPTLTRSEEEAPAILLFSITVFSSLIG